MNFLTIFYKKPKNWFELNKGILFSVCARWTFCFLFFVFLEVQSFLVFRRTKIGEVYLAQNLYKEREQSEIVGGGFVYLFILLFIYLLCRYFSDLVVSIFHF